MFKQEKGVTLVALVITIVVLLILAGVSITGILGQNGILTRATTAKSDTENAAKAENDMYNEADKYFQNFGM